MFFRFFFRRLSNRKQAEILRNKGTFLGTRTKNGRDVYIYMLNSLFVEVVYKEDNANNDPEHVRTLSGLKRLNAYLEGEFKTSFAST